MKKKVICFLLLILFIFNNSICLANIDGTFLKYPSYDYIFLNSDTHENLNRKIFMFNMVLNKIFAKKIHILWASVVPDFLINGINNMYSNIEFPKRLISSIVQHDKNAVKNETKRFFINSIAGLGGFFDVALKFNIEMFDEDMEQAFAKCKIKCGDYLVLPFISSTTSRDILGRIFDFLLNPTLYIATPITTVIKIGLLINRTAKIQPMIALIESNFADGYDIAKKIFGVEKYIKLSNYDRKSVLDSIKDNYDELELVDTLKKEENLQVRGRVNENKNLVVNEIKNNDLSADIFLNDYYPQSPINDSMRTALFDLKIQNKTFWNEISIWNRNFNKKIKSAEIEVSPDREKYRIRYLLQKNKTAPLALIFPSIGEGVNNSHSTILAKIFYDEGYSILIFGSHFQWEFLKSIEKTHRLGFIKDDIKFINKLISNSILYLSKKYDRTFLKRTAIGTSLGAYTVLFLANNQYETGANNIDKFISVCPPFELFYAVAKMDEIIASWKKYPNDYKEKTAITVAKVMRAYKNKNKLMQNFKELPFTNYEAKLISAFVFHQKLSDLIYTTELENNPKIDKKELYSLIYNSNFSDYISKYLLVNHNIEDLRILTSMKSISNYFINSDNYKIFHSMDDYLINKEQLKELKEYCNDKLVLFSNGAHLGFLYRDEFINSLRNEIKLK